MHNKQNFKSNVVESNNKTTSNIKLLKNNNNISNIVLGSTFKTTCSFVDCFEQSDTITTTMGD